MKKRIFMTWEKKSSLQQLMLLLLLPLIATYFYSDPHALKGPLEYFVAKNSRLLLSPIVWGKNLSLKEVKFFAQLVILVSLHQY